MTSEDAAAVRTWAVAHARSVGRSGKAAGNTTRASTAESAVAEPEWDWTAELSFRLDQTLEGHTNSAWTVAWSPDPHRPLLATASTDRTARIWDPGTGDCLHTLTGHSLFIEGIGWCRDPHRALLATGGGDRTVRIWDAGTGECLRTLTAHTSAVRSVAWSPDPDHALLASASSDCTIRIWDASTGECLRTLAEHISDVHSVAWSPDPDRPLLATTSGDNTIRIWNPHTGECLRTLTGHTSRIWSVAWSPDPDRALLATASSDGTARIWNPHTGECLRTLNEHVNVVWSVAWSPGPDHLLLATASNDRTVRIWNPGTGECLSVIEHPQGVSSAVFASLPDRRIALATGCTDNQARVWTAAPPNPRPTTTAHAITVIDCTPPELTEHAFRMSWSPDPDNPLLATVDWESRGHVRAARIWDVNSGRLVRELTGHTNTVLEVVWSPDPHEPLLATASSDGTARIWDFATGACLRTISHTSHPNAVAWSPDPRRPLLATTSFYGSGDIWDPVTGEHLEALTDYEGMVDGPVWSPDNRLAVLATASPELDGLVHIWHLGADSPVRTLRVQADSVHQVAWSANPARPLLATAGSDATARIWDPDTGQCVRTLAGHTRSVDSVAWSPDSDRPLLATGGEDNTTRIWDPETGQCLYTINHESWVLSVAWARNAGRLLLAVAIHDASIRIYEITRSGDRPPTTAGTDETPREASGTSSVAIQSLLDLGARGLWAPLGLVTDLIELTAPGGTATAPDLNNAFLKSIVTHPAVQRLRELAWPPSARVALAALLAQHVTADSTYTPPPDTPLAALRGALDSALHTTSIDSVPAPISTMDEIIRAADAITEKTITLLTLLGAQTCAANPTLPLTLQNYAPRLPDLAALQHQLLAQNHAPDTKPRQLANAQTTIRTPGTIGINNSGSLATATPTELALPEMLFTLRYANGQLLHYAHPTHQSPPLTPLTLILDTTPPTYGPCENVLRLLAHLLTTTLWQSGQHPTLFTASNPRHAQPLTDRADLVRLWSARTLNPPRPALHTAIQTAAATSTHPMLILTTSHTAVELITSKSATPSRHCQFVTTHTPGTAPPSKHADGLHHHTLDVEPPPTQHQISVLIQRILAAAAETRDTPANLAAPTPARRTALANRPLAADRSSSSRNPRPRTSETESGQPPISAPGLSELEFELEWRVRERDGWTTAVDCVVAPSGDLLIATGSSNGAVRIWGRNESRALISSKDHSGAVFSLAWLLTDRRVLLASCSFDGARIRDLATNAQVHIPSGEVGYGRALAWRPGNALRPLLAMDDSLGNLRLWDALAATDAGSLSVHTGQTRSIDWSAAPNGRSLLATTADHAALIWDGDGGNSLHALYGHTGDVLCVAWSDSTSGPLLATGSADHTVRIWDSLHGACLRTLTGHADAVTSVDWTATAEGRPLLISGGMDGVVHVWDALAGTLVATLHLSRAVTSVSAATKPDGRICVVAGSIDANSRLWTAASPPSSPAWHRSDADRAESRTSESGI